MTPVLECKNVSKKIKNFSLEGIDFALEPGYILGVIGENGAGKSTLMQLILGGYQLDGLNTREWKKKHSMEMSSNSVDDAMGDIAVAGYSLRFHSNEAKQHLAFVLQDCPFARAMTALENGKLYGESYNTWNQQRFEGCCKEFGIPMSKPLYKFSKGQQVMFQLAFSLSYDASVYILDEPCGHLDLQMRQKVLSVMQELVETGRKSIVYVTHQLEDLDQIGDYILWLDKGKQVLYGQKEEILDEYRIINATEKQLRYIEQTAPGRLLVQQIRPHSCEAFIRKGEPLPHRVEMHTPTLEELLYYYNQYREQPKETSAVAISTFQSAGVEEKGKKSADALDERKYYESPY